MIIDPFGHIPVGRGGGEGVILYSNPSGATGNITLSSNINGYKYVEVYYKKNSCTIERTYSPSSGFEYPEGFPDKEEVSENNIPECVGVAKTAVANSGATNVYIGWETLRVLYSHSLASSYYWLRKNFWEYKYQAVASLSGDTFSWGSPCFKNGSHTYVNGAQYYYSNGKFTVYIEGTKTAESCPLECLETATCAPKIYSIVAYR